MSQETIARFFDSRSAYLMFTTATNEKAVVAARIGEFLDTIHPGPRALRIFDAGMGDATVLTHLMRQMHNAFMHIPWLIVGKEISIEDVRLALDKMPDRFYEHPETVLVITNMHYREAPSLRPLGDEVEVDWQEIPLQGSTTEDFARQIRQVSKSLSDGWAVQTSPKTGNPLYVRPAVRVLYRNDRRFLLNEIIPRRRDVEGVYDLAIASQPYRARTTTERKVKSVLVPLTEALAPGGRLVGIHSHGNDPGMEIIRGVWPEEDPFVTDRHGLAEGFRTQVTDPDLVFEDFDDEASIFQYQLHAMPSELKEHIGTSLVMAAWNAAAYVAQIDEDRLSAALTSGAYVTATSDVLRLRGGVWFNDELYVISRRG
jgi:hypothetical protein